MKENKNEEKWKKNCKNRIKGGRKCQKKRKEKNVKEGRKN